MISSEINDLPLESRLDALLSQINHAEQDAASEDEFDYAEFARKRAEEARSTQAPVTSSNALEPAIPLSDDLDDYELMEADFIEPSQAVADQGTPRLSRVTSSPGGLQSSPLVNRGSNSPVDLTANSPVHSPATSPRVVSSPGLASSPQQQAEDRDADLLSEIYAEAGVAPPSPKSANDAAVNSPANSPANSTNGSPINEPRRRPTRKAAEAAARENQRLERALELEVGTRTAASASVDSFLAMLDDASDPPSATTPITSPQTPHNNAHAKQIMLSSPPSARKLASFVRSIAPVGSAADDDSDLEIVPQTDKSRRSRPVRALLSFARPHEANAASGPVRKLFADLQLKQRQQILSARMAKVQQMQAMGVEVSEETKAAAEGPAENSTESYLERERRLADELRKREKREETGDFFGLMDSDSDGSDDEPNLNGANQRDDDEDNGVDVDNIESRMDDDEESIHSASDLGSDSDSDLEILDVETVPRQQQSRRQLVDSDEEENEEDDEPENQPVQAVPQPTQAVAQPTEVAPTEAVAQPTQAVQPLIPALRRAEPQATQVLPEVSSDRLRELLGGVPEAEEETHNEPEEASIVDEIDLSDSGSDVNEQAAPRKEVPDLSDLKDAQLTRSQEMREVRQRYLAAQEKEFAAPFVDDQAEESDDEWAGMGGRSDDDGHDDDDGRDLKGLVNDKDVANNQSKVWQLYNQQERDRDDVELNRLVDDVHNGFRRRRGGNGLLDGLSDSESDGERRKAQDARRAREKRKRAKMLEGSTEVAKLAANEKTMAFVESMAADLIKPVPTDSGRATAMSVHESLRFLSEAAEPEPERERYDPVDIGEDDAGLPRAMFSVRPVRKASSSIGQGQTYAARVAAVEKGVKSVEVLQSLGVPTRAPKAKRARVLAAPTSHKPVPASTSLPRTGSLFRRQWQ